MTLINNLIKRFSCYCNINMSRPSDNKQVFHFSARWSVPHTEENRKTVTTWLQVNADKDWVFQAEDTKDNPHYQIYFHTSERIRPKTLAIRANCEMNGFNIQAAATQGKEVLRTYCFKEERVDGPWGKRPIYTGDDLNEISKCMLPWQQYFYDLIQSKPDRRTIHWVYNPSGNVGKTMFVKYMFWKKLATIIDYGTAMQIKTAVIEEGPRRCYLIDLPRVKGSDESIYSLFSAIESVKNGLVRSTMYGKSQHMLMSPPHVICFSNHLPKVGICSLDRWKIYHLEDSNSPLNTLSTKDI